MIVLVSNLEALSKQCQLASNWHVTVFMNDP